MFKFTNHQELAAVHLKNLKSSNNHSVQMVRKKNYEKEQDTSQKLIFMKIKENGMVNLGYTHTYDILLQKKALHLNLI